MLHFPLLLIVFGELVCTYADVSGDLKIETEKLRKSRRYNNKVKRIKNSLYFVPMEYVDALPVEINDVDPWNYYYYARKADPYDKKHEYLKFNEPKHKDGDQSRDFQVQTYNPSPIKTKYVITNFGEMVRNAQNETRKTGEENSVTPPMDFVPSTDAEYVDDTFVPILEDSKDAREAKVGGSNNRPSDPIAVYTVRPDPEEGYDLDKPEFKGTVVPEVSLYQPATPNIDEYKEKIDRYSNEIKYRTLWLKTTMKRPYKTTTEVPQQGNASTIDDVFFPTRKEWNYIPSSRGRQVEKIRYMDAPSDIGIYSPKDSKEAAFMYNYYKKMQTESSGDVVITPTISDFLQMNSNKDRTVENLLVTQTTARATNRKAEVKYKKLFTARRASTPSDFVYLKYRPFKSSTRGAGDFEATKDVLKDVEQECCSGCTFPEITPCWKPMCTQTTCTQPSCCKPWCKTTPCPKTTCSSCPGLFKEMEDRRFNSAEQIAADALKSQVLQQVEAPAVRKEAASSSRVDKQLILELYEELHWFLVKVIALENSAGDDYAAFTEHAANSRQLVNFMTDLVSMSNRISNSVRKISDAANDLKDEGEMSMETTRTRIHTLRTRLAEEQAKLTELRDKIREGNECRKSPPPPPTRKRKKFRLFPWKRD